MTSDTLDLQGGKRTLTCQNGPKQAEIYIYNSLTRKKDRFEVEKPKRVKWYICGPTVYDSAHMGHARAYLSFDILRRIMQNYFGFDVQYTMNITDIDDKIIKRARQHFLLETYQKEKFCSFTLAEVLKDVLAAMELFKAKSNVETDPDKKKMFDEMGAKVNVAVKELESALSSNDAKAAEVLKDEIFPVAKDIIADWLDSQRGHTVSDLAVFDKLAKRYEKEFLEDMASLNVLPPNVLTRVSEYIPEIIAYVEKIIRNGYGYITNDGSVYFDTVKFDRNENHRYAKLVPEAFGDNEQLAKNMRESEGELSLSNLQEKRNPTDFALWKSSKSGEPFWESPWGKGRPGWHIECSTMSSEIFRSSLDIHAGGFDLKFPHHDNEIAQAEAYYNIDNWVKYFLHCGTLRISGLKMSKSLKNFITIRDALKQYTARQLRLLFLMHNWSDELDYSTTSMERALQFEKIANEFFLLVKDYARRFYKADSPEGFRKFEAKELELLDSFSSKRAEIDAALCDSFDTRTAIEKLRELIALGNEYVNKLERDNVVPNCLLLKDVADYIRQLLDIFGAIGFPAVLNSVSSQAQGTSDMAKEEMLMPYLNALVEYREKVRKIAKECRATEILEECDRLRDEILPELGVRLEDRTAQTCVKLVDRDTLLREQQQKREIEAAKAEGKRRKQQERKEKEAAKRIPPAEMFKRGEEAAKYSKYDESGIPTHLANGEEISKKQRKKLEKLYEIQQRNYAEAMDSTRDGVLCEEN